MKTMEFKFWMKSFDRMSRSQSDKLRGRLQREARIDEVTTLTEQSLNDEPAK